MPSAASSSLARPSGAPAPPPLTLLFTGAEICLWGFAFQLGRVRRSLAELQRDGLLCNEPEALAAQGYQHNCGTAPGESLLALAAGPFAALLEQCPSPRALVCHHSYRDSATLAPGEPQAGFMSQVRYFPAGLLQQSGLDHIPYFGSFGSGCTGLLSMLVTAAGLCPKAPSSEALLCLTADIKPPRTTYDALRERILASDACSGFLLGPGQRGCRLLGLSYYSTTRQIVPLVEIVKRSVQLIRELARALELDLAAEPVCVHYPNIFPTAWDMVSQYLKIPRESHILDGMADRAHCLSSDSMISLSKELGRRPGRLHIVLNFGSGLHLGACVLREEARA